MLIDSFSTESEQAAAWHSEQEEELWRTLVVRPKSFGKHYLHAKGLLAKAHLVAGVPLQSAPEC